MQLGGCPFRYVNGEPPAEMNELAGEGMKVEAVKVGPRLLLHQAHLRGMERLRLVW